MKKFILFLLSVSIVLAQSQPSNISCVGSKWTGSFWQLCIIDNSNPVVSNICMNPAGCKNSGDWKAFNASSGSSLSLTGSLPVVVTPDPITGTGDISCPTCGTIGGVATDTQLSYGTGTNTIGSSTAFTVDKTNGLMTITPTGTGTTLTVNGDSAAGQAIYAISRSGGAAVIGQSYDSAFSDDPIGGLFTAAESDSGAGGLNATGIAAAAEIDMPGAGDSIYTVTSLSNAGGGPDVNVIGFEATVTSLGTITGIAAAYEADSGWPYFLYDTDTSALNLLAGSTTTGDLTSTGSITATSVIQAGGSLDHATLGTPANATMGWCATCTISACTTAGTGAWAFYNTASTTWSCPF